MSDIQLAINLLPAIKALDISAVEAIGITWTYLGRTLEGVFERYPELEGSNDILSHIWS